MHTSIKINADPLSGRYEVMKNPNRARQNLYLIIGSFNSQGRI